MYYLLVICLALATLLAINLLASVLVTGLWHCVSGLLCRWSAQARAKLLFALRLFPATAAFVIVGALFIPSYVLYEPQPADEVVGTKLAMIAAFSAAGIAMALWRGFAAFRATGRLLEDWMSRAEAITIQASSLPCYCLSHSFPLIAVVGIFRPRLVISRRVLESLDHKEMRAALQHEVGHVFARDNLKRVAMRICRDLLGIIPCGRSLDRAWKKASEAAADDYVARAGRTAALDLASALLKVARLVPQDAKPACQAGAFLIGEETQEISWRVLRLAEMADSGCKFDEANDSVLNAATWGCFCLFVGAVVAAAASPPTLEKLHAAMEHLFPFLN